MQIILLDEIKNLGKLGDQVNVKSGYARNFLIPKGKAVQANKKNIEIFKRKRTELEANLNKILLDAEELAKKIESIESIVIPAKSGREGKLFGSIGARDISNALTLSGVKVHKNEVRLPKGALRTIGMHQIKIQLHSEVTAIVQVKIVAE